MRRVRVIDDLKALKVVADPTRAAIVELLTEPRSVSQLASALDVPRTRLYHHIALLEENGFVEQVAERRVGALMERIYALTAKSFRPSARLLRSGDVDALTTLLFDTTKADVQRAIAAGEIDLEQRGDLRTVAAGRSIGFLSEERAADFIRELEALVERFDAAHAAETDARPYALVWALYPSSRRIG